jgi:dihydrofolate reductase
MNRVVGILAASSNHVIGQGEKIPWHHRGDFKRFKELTLGNGVLMGYPTFMGMSKYYTKPGNQVLPGRSLFVVGREPFELPDNDLSNVEFLPTYGPQDDIETALGFLPEERRLFIAGGARVYRDYLKFARTIYFTRIEAQCEVDDHTVFLAPETRDLLTNPVYWRTISSNGFEISDGLRASYIELNGVI